MSYSQRIRFVQKNSALTDISISIKNEFLDFCESWYSGEINTVDVLDKLAFFLNAYNGNSLSVPWPPNSEYVIGTDISLKITDFEKYMSQFTVLRRVQWYKCIGLVCIPNIENVIFKPTWITVTSEGTVFGFNLDENKLCKLCCGLCNFLLVGLKNMRFLYESLPASKYADNVYFNHDLSDAHIYIMNTYGIGDGLLSVISTYCGIVFSNFEDPHYFKIGTVGNIRVADVVPEKVIKTLIGHDLIPIGEYSENHRMVLMQKGTGFIFVLLSDGFVFMVSSNLIGFIRARLYPLSVGEKCYINPAANPDDRSVGSQIRFDEHLRYVLPFDQNILKTWLCKYTDLTGWATHIVA